MLPQPGLQVGFAGKETLLLVSWVINQVTPLFCGSISLVTVAVKGCCSPVGTVAVEGVMPTAIPELMLSVALPVIFGSACDVAVKRMLRRQVCGVAVAQLVPVSLVGSGILLGAV